MQGDTLHRNPYTPTIMTISKTKILLPSIVVSALLGHAAQGATLSVDRNWNATASVSGGVNSGGIEVGANNLTNGNDVLNLLLTIDDSADTGATFTAVMTLSGTTGDTTGQLWTEGGNVVFWNGSADRTATLKFSIGSIVQTGGPAATASFDGFKEISVTDWNDANGRVDTFDFGGSTYTTAYSNPITFDALVANNSTLNNVVESQFKASSMQTEWTVTAVPEPSPTPNILESDEQRGLPNTKDGYPSDKFTSPF